RAASLRPQLSKKSMCLHPSIGRSNAISIRDALMKSTVSGFVTAILLSAGVVAQAQEPSHGPGFMAEGATLLAIGPVESINPKSGIAIILGQQVLLPSALNLNVGESVAVFGKSLPDGRLQASLVRQEGNYVAGSTNILLTGTVQSMNAAVGHAVVSGVSVDLTPMMSAGAVSLAVGSEVRVLGTQPSSHGVIIVSGVSGGGLSGFSGVSGGGHGVSGGGFSGVSGGGLSGVSGGGHGVSGGGFSGVSGGGLSGVSGGGHGVSGGGFSGVSGGGLSGVSGGGLSGVSGGGHGVSGGGLSGVSGGGLSGVSGGGHGVSGGGLSGVRGGGRGVSGGGLSGVSGGGHGVS